MKVQKWNDSITNRGLLHQARQYHTEENRSWVAHVSKDYGAMIEYTTISNRVITAGFHSRFQNVSTVHFYSRSDSYEVDVKNEFCNQLNVSSLPVAGIKIYLGDLWPK